MQHSTNAIRSNNMRFGQHHRYPGCTLRNAQRCQLKVTVLQALCRACCSKGTAGDHKRNEELLVHFLLPICSLEAAAT